MEEQKQIKINENILHLGGTATLPEKLEVGGDYTLGVLVSCDSAKLKSNDDGTFDMTYYCRPTGEIVINTKWGKNIRAKGRGSQAQKLYMALMQEHVESGFGGEFNSFYEKVMVKMIDNPRKLLEFLEKI
jgi:hypothetical protein